jgi:hypothetical protein
MPVNVYWEDSEKTLLRYDFLGKWTWNDLYHALNKAQTMEMSVTNRVDVLLDMRHSITIPDSALTHIRNLVEKQPPNVGIFVVITQSKFITSLFEAAARLYQRVALYVFIASNEALAHDMIASARVGDEGVVNQRALPNRRFVPH